MSLVRLLNKWHNSLWEFTHPEEALRRLEERMNARTEQNDPHTQEIRAQVLALRQGQDSWRSTVDNPNSTSEALKQAVLEEVHSWEQVWDIEHAGGFGNWGNPVFDEVDAWREEFQRSYIAHPNLPPELFRSTFALTDSMVAGLLENPALPLIILESPHFVESFSTEERRELIRKILKHEKIPPILLDLLKTDDPWLALEIQTHVAVSTTPDLEWLEAQIATQLRSEQLSRRCLVYELACHGLIPDDIEPVVPWGALAASSQSDIASHSLVREMVQELDRFTELNPKERENALLVWIENLLLYKDRNVKVPYLEAALSHRKAPAWVGKCIAKGWPYSEHKSAWSLHRIITLQQGRATAGVVKQMRLEAIQEALELWRESLNPSRSNLGIFYLVMRDLPDVLQGQDLNPKYRRAQTQNRVDDTLPDIRDRSFLIRLAVALCLQDTDTQHQELREILQSDPNQYVRAAARKEIVWPRGQ